MVRRLAGICLLFVALLLIGATKVYADQPLQSSHFSIYESVVGGGGLLQENSGHYQVGEFIGDLAVGSSASSNFQLQSGFDTTEQPSLTFIIDSSGINLGTFSPSTAAVSTSQFEVIDYTSYGYIVQIYGNPPTNGSHTITAMSTTDVSQAGVEQFGINLVANTSPTTVGADPDNGQFGVGQAAANYDTPNNYRYVSGETIAVGPKTSGNTIYTISYLVNVTSLTPGGQYSSNQTLICIGTY